MQIMVEFVAQGQTLLRRQSVGRLHSGRINIYVMYIYIYIIVYNYIYILYMCTVHHIMNHEMWGAVYFHTYSFMASSRS